MRAERKTKRLAAARLRLMKGPAGPWLHVFMRVEDKTWRLSDAELLGNGIRIQGCSTQS